MHKALLAKWPIHRLALLTMPRNRARSRRGRSHGGVNGRRLPRAPLGRRFTHGESQNRVAIEFTVSQPRAFERLAVQHDRSNEIALASAGDGQQSPVGTADDGTLEGGPFK